MARTVTRDTLRDRIRFDGDYPNSRVYTDARLNDEINRAIGEFWRLLSEADDDRYTTSSTVTISANAESGSLPADFWRLRKVTLLNASSEEVHKLRRIEFGDLHRFRLNGSDTTVYRRGYCIVEDSLHVRPIQGANATYKVWYIPAPPTLADDVTEVDGYAGFEDLIVELVCYRLDKREKRPLEERIREIERLKQSYRASLGNRDSNEPQYLEDLAQVDYV